MRACVRACAVQVRVALGTGSYMMAYVMFFVALTFINRQGMDDIITLYHVLLTAPFGVLVRPARGKPRLGGRAGLANGAAHAVVGCHAPRQGALLGSRYALQVNETVLMVIIMLVCFLLFTLAQVYSHVTAGP